jgi:hypothetical protein
VAELAFVVTQTQGQHLLKFIKYLITCVLMRYVFICLHDKATTEIIIVSIMLQRTIVEAISIKHQFKQIYKAKHNYGR